MKKKFSTNGITKKFQTKLFSRSTYIRSVMHLQEIVTEDLNENWKINSYSYEGEKSPKQESIDDFIYASTIVKFGIVV